jgi:hypothetical protein
MSIKFQVCATAANTEFAPLAALCAIYQRQQCFQPLEQILETTRQGDYSLKDKLLQVLVSMLAGCQTLSEINPHLRSESGLAQLLGCERIADQSTLSRTLDGLSRKQIEQIRAASNQILRSFSATERHDGRGYLWLEYDLSGLPCSARAQESQKGYFSGKKTPGVANWPGSAA